MNKIKSCPQFIKENIETKVNRMSYIPTYEEAKAIVKSKGELVFYETVHNVEGYKVSVFNYRLAGYNDFINPVPGKAIDAKEMRGLCFIFNLDGSLYKRFLMLKKFWNVNQVPETQFNVIKDMKVKAVYNKEDGSLISFYELPNGKILPKTKASLDNEQVDEVKILYANNENLQNFVAWCFKKNYIPMFEFVSFKNKIVLNYEKTDLILLKLRDNKTGKYIDIKTLDNIEGISVAPFDTASSLDELMTRAETEENKEGWVVELIDDKGDAYLVKQKTVWYFARHRLLTTEVNREDDIIGYILDNTIDDVISQLHPDLDAEKIEWIKDIENKVKIFMQKKKIEVEKLVSLYNGNMKNFAISNRKDKNFGLAVSFIGGRNKYDVISDYVRKKTSHLAQAKNFVNSGEL